MSGAKCKRNEFDATNRTLSFTFANETQRQLLLDVVLWLGDPQAKPTR